MTQDFSPRRVLVVVNARNENACSLVQELIPWLEERSCTVRTRENTCQPSQYREVNPHLALVLGGDGTLLGVARAFTVAPVPLLGINFGKVGFLAELHADRWQQGLEAVLSGSGDTLRRMCLGWRVLRQGVCVHSGHAINDVVIGRGALSRVISLNISADGNHVCRVRADGLIFSSPLGVSGYAVSAGGPLVHPDINALTITPICPYLCNFPPMVLPHPMTVQAEVESTSIETFLTLDGQEGLKLEEGDIVEVFCVPDAVHFARLEADVYFRRLKVRGFIEDHSSF